MLYYFDISYPFKTNSNLSIIGLGHYYNSLYALLADSRWKELLKNRLRARKMTSLFNKACKTSL